MEPELLITHFFIGFLALGVVFPYFYKKKPSAPIFPIIILSFIISYLVYLWALAWETNAMVEFNQIMALKVSGFEKYTWYFTLLAASIEELTKLVGLFILMHLTVKNYIIKDKKYPLPTFGKLGIISAILIGGLFSSYENLLYVKYSTYQESVEILMDRVIAGVFFIHVTAVYINYYFITHHKKFIPIGIILSIIFHATYNYLVFMAIFGRTSDFYAWLYAWGTFFIIVFLPNGGINSMNQLIKKFKQKQT
ncbi:hypothetical protein LCGC14_0175910 [marine sediment metagenome]|uniref:PrsW family intramembrane metalloprotease n=1 Tax=marine sediment metagenome TaxID=412755 RepID=A0A0F9V7M8_9ZZZZ